MTGAIQIPLDDLILDTRLQTRAVMDMNAIDEYADNLFDLPPSKAVRCGEQVWLTEGWHRYHAHKKAKQETMPVIVREGTWLDALAEAAGSNHGHGLKRTNDDKRRAVACLLAEPLWAERSDRLVAQACHVSGHMVAEIRRAHSLTSPQADASSQDTKRTDASGRQQPAKKPPVKPRCNRCKRLWPDKDQSTPGCTACHELRKAARKPEEPPEVQETEEVPPAPIVDDDGKPVPESLLPVFRMVGLFKTFERQLTAAAKTAKLIENATALKLKKPLSGKKHYGEMFGAIKNARYRVRAMRPALVDGDDWLTVEEVEARP